MASGFGDVVLLGIGSSTKAAAAYLLGLPEGEVSSVTVYGGSAPREAGEALEALGARVVWDSEGLDRPYDLAVSSPGLPCSSPLYQSAVARCAEVVSEPELAWRESPRDWVAVTGTNGKTTTTSLVRHLFEEAGRPVRAVGNIGLPPVACVADRAEGEVFAAELSSFQLHGTVLFAPRVAVLLNVTPDHLEWHGTFEAYAADKERVFANMTGRDLCVLGDDGPCRAMAERLRLRGLPVVVVGEVPCACEAHGAWLADDGRLTVRLGGREHALCRWDEMALKGPHNLQNSLAAATAALFMGVSDEAVARGLLGFSPLAHRVEPCGEADGVAFVDDSKATNTDAALKALAAFEAGRVVLLLGGHDKLTDLTDLARAAVDRCRAVVAYGEAGERIEGALRAAIAERPGAAVVRAATMARAFEAACAAAQPGDTVLLSPACSSFDEFSGYKQRGEAFQRLVAERAARCAGEGRS